MRLTILYDNTVYRASRGLMARWGFSCLVETGKRRILFDTGGDGQVLLSNMAALDVHPETIDTIVISHEHWDHAGGLPSLLERNPDVRVYRLKKPSSPAAETIPVDEPRSIADGVFSTGRLPGSPVDEQSLVIRCGKRWCVLAGCSHPGVAAILDAAGRHGHVDGVIGGLHGFDSYGLLDGMMLVCPTHCTRHVDEIRRRYPDRYIKGGVGRVIHLER